MADIFSEDAGTPDTSPVEVLVGEGKKFKTVEDLARGKLESDNHIKNLEAELAAARSDLSARQTVEAQIAALKAKEVVPPPVAVTPPQVKDQVVVTEEDLNKRIEATMERRNSQETVQRNLNTVEQRLVEVYGSQEKASEAVKARAQELNVSVKFLESVAAQSPVAFFSTVGVSTAQHTDSKVTRSDVNPSALPALRAVNQPIVGTYDDARNRQGRLDAKALLDPAYLASTMKAAMADPNKFLASAS